MKRFLCVIAIILALCIPVSATSASPRIVAITPGLSFSGTTATCTLRVNSDYYTDTIEATVTLTCGGRTVATWECESNGYLVFSDTTSVEKGKLYTLTAEVTINNVTLDPVTHTGRCN